MAQSRWWSRRSFTAGLGFAAVVAAVAAGTAQSATDKWWPGYSSGPDNSRFFESRQINKSNVNQLQVAWTYPFGDTGSHSIVVRGVVYGRGRNGSLVAVDAKTGKELWVRENMNGMTSRGFNYWESADGRDQRLIFAMNSLLQQVDATTGKSIMTFGTNGVVDLRVGLDGRDPATIGNIQSNNPGETFENLIILGSATGEGYMSPPGDIRAYDVLSGRLVWTFHTVPRPGEFGYDTWPKNAYKYVGGVNNWGEMTIDTQRASPTFRSVRPPTTSTAPIVSAQTCLAPRSSRSRRAPATGSGTFSSCTTTSGTSTEVRRRS
jgi:quinoprotein glucose dehydrogenase